MIAINVKLQNIFGVVCVKEEKLSDSAMFLQAVVDVFEIESPEDVIIEFFNNKRAPVGFDILPTIVKQYKTDSNFFLEIRIDGPQSFTKQAENLENYLRDHHCESILFEEKRLNRLSEDSLAYLLNHLAEYMQHEYSVNPTPGDLVEMSEAVIQLFPSLTSRGEDKLCILYDRVNKTGLLYEKVRYKVRRIKSKQFRNSMAAIIAEDDQKQIDELVKYFESCVLPGCRAELLGKLEISSGLRLKSNGTNRELFAKSFHLYRVDSDLVLEDFKFMFSNIDPTSLLTKWDGINQRIQESYPAILDRKVSHYHRNEMISGILKFLKIFPVHKIGFERGVDALIVFSEDPKTDPQTMIKKDSLHPHIISIYSKETNTSRFYIVVSGSLMNVPNNYSFLQVMDMFCKIHYIFCVPFNPPLAQFMAVIQKQIYGMECDTKFTPSTNSKLKNIFNAQANIEVVEVDVINEIN